MLTRAAMEHLENHDRRLTAVEQILPTLATKQDLLATKQDLEEGLTHLRSELKGDMATLGTELGTEMADLRTELRQDMADLRTELKSDIADVREDIGMVADAVAGLVVRLERKGVI